MTIIARRQVLSALVGTTITRPFRARAQGQIDRLLFCTLAAGYRHEVIPLSHVILKQIAEGSGLFDVTVTEDVAEFTADRLRRYAAVMFFTTGELPMSDAQKVALLEFVRSGHGFMGVHSATDTFYTWPDYLNLIGGYFNEHPWHQTVTINVVEPANPLVSFLGNSLQIADEIYQIRDFDVGGSRVLLRLDEASVDLTRSGVRRRPYGWPLAWTRSYGAGRVYYTALGHEDAVWRDPRYQRLLLNAILWSIRRAP